MGKISQFEQNQLASALTGTPGTGVAGIAAPNVSTGGAELGQAVTRAAAGVQGELNTTIQAQRAEDIRRLRELEAERKAAAKQLLAAEQDTEVNRRTMQYDTAVTEARTAAQEAHKFDPDKGLQAYGETIKDLPKQFLDDITNPLIKTRVQKGIDAVNAQSAQGMTTWREGRAADNIKANIGATAAELKKKWANSGMTHENVLLDKAQYITNNMSSYQALYGPEAQSKMDADIAEGLTARIADVANQGEAGRLQAEIDFWSSQKMLDPEKAAPFLSRERAIEAAKVAEAEKQRVVTAGSTAIGAMETWANTDKDNLGAVTDALTAQEDILKTMIDNPQTYTKADVAAQVSRVNEARKVVDNWDKDQSDEVREARDMIINSAEAIKAREGIIRLQNKMMTSNLELPQNIKLRQKAISEYQKAVEGYNKAGFLSQEHYKSYSKWGATRQNKLNNDLQKGSGKRESDAVKVFNKAKEGINAIQKMFPQQPKPKGKTKLKKSDASDPADAMSQKYQSAFFANLDRYEAITGEMPTSEYTINRIHELAMEQIYFG